MEHKERHVCIVDPRVCVYYDCGHWRIDDLDEGRMIPIKYCPHCGMDLDALNMEVSRKRLRGWVRLARGIKRYLKDGPLVAARCDIDVLIDSISKALTDG